MLNKEQQNFAMWCVTTWIELCEDNGIQCVNSPDADHSALLQYLLRGNAPFEKPPPLAYSYPWYSIVEGNKEMIELDELEDEVKKTFEFGDVTIRQNPHWDWEDKEKGILKFALTDDLYQFTPATVEEAAGSHLINPKAKFGFLQRIGGEAPRMDGYIQ